MKLNYTREEWADELARWCSGGMEQSALEDLATLFAEVDRLTAQLAEREGRDREAVTALAEAFSAPERLSKSLSFMDRVAKIITDHEPRYPRFHAAEGEGRKPHTHVTNKGMVLEMPEGVECPLCRIASAHAAEDKSHDA